ncbi:MAG: polysaccharide pyruvyl transferase family protein [Ruminococcus sp.]|nr:polysaccharide pyruvyl transferase family protein [Ruminococcus sp.]
MRVYRRIKKKICPNAPEFQREKYAKQQHPEIRVLLAGLMMSTNLGDGVISDCVKYLIRRIAKENKIKNLKISTMDIRKQKTKKDLAAVRNSDIMFFPGGGLVKYQVEKLPGAMERYISPAEHYGIPVYLNSVGVEGYDEEDANCRLLCDMLSLNCIKGVTCRDYADFLNTHYLKGEVKSLRVSDPAVWAQDAYDTEKVKDSQTVGLGVARGGLFTDYGIEYTKEQLLLLWKDIIEELDSKGIKWKLFTNGFKGDEDFLYELLRFIGREDEAQELAVRKPETPKELVENISKFKGVIALRMHANIVAYGLDIPCVGLVWNQKMTAFAQNAGIAHRFLNYDMFCSKEIVSLLEDAFSEGYDKNIREAERKSIYDSIEQILLPFVKDIISCRRRDLTKVKTVSYGLPNLESDKLNRELFENDIDYYVSDDEEQVGTTCLGKPVYSTKKLKKRFGKKPFVLISTTVDYTPCAKALISYGYRERYDFVNMHAYKRYVFKKGDVFVDNTVGIDKK